MCVDVFFFVKMWVGSLKTQVSPKNTNPQISDGNTKTVEGSAGAH